MGERTAIEWAEATWNPIVGCEIVSPGCKHCYAMGEAARQERLAKAAGRETPYAGTTQASKAGPVWTGKVALAERALTAPLKRRTPTTYFVNSMGDLFADGVEDAWLDKVWAVMALCPQHTFLVLTKRPERMREYVHDLFDDAGTGQRRLPMIEIDHPAGRKALVHLVDWEVWHRPLPNVWLGVTAEDQPRAAERIPALLDTPAAVHFVSYEPAIGPLDLTRVRETDGCSYDTLRGRSGPLPWQVPFQARLDWVICGGESGRGEHVRPMHPDWARQVRDDCVGAGVPFFFKQWGEWLAVEELRRRPDGQGPGFGSFDHCVYDGDAECVRVGKRRAGRQLDGVLHDARPGVTGG